MLEVRYRFLTAKNVGLNSGMHKKSIEAAHHLQDDPSDLLSDLNSSSPTGESDCSPDDIKGGPESDKSNKYEQRATSIAELRAKAQEYHEKLQLEYNSRGGLGSFQHEESVFDFAHQGRIAL